MAGHPKISKAQGASRPAPSRPREALPDTAFCLQWLYFELPSKAAAGTTIHGIVVARNVSKSTWPDRKMAGYSVGHFAVRLSWRWAIRGHSGELRFVTGYQGRADLTAPVPPGGTARFDVEIPVGKRSGKHALQLDLLQEDIAWFGDRGSPEMIVPIEIVGPHKPGLSDLPTSFPSGHN